MSTQQPVNCSFFLHLHIFLPARPSEKVLILPFLDCAIWMTFLTEKKPFGMAQFGS